VLSFKAVLALMAAAILALAVGCGDDDDDGGGDGRGGTQEIVYNLPTPPSACSIRRSWPRSSAFSRRRA
jgi:hypothetical protein